MVKFIAAPQDSYQYFSKLSSTGCTVPFKHIEIHSWGQVSICCHTWLPEWCGNLLNDSVEEVMNNIKKKEIQEGMRRGDYSSCNDLCPQLNQFLTTGLDEERAWSIVPLERLDKQIAFNRYQIYFSYDPSCNLQCPSCRKGLIVHRPDDPKDTEAARIVKIHNKVKELVKYLLDQGEKVDLSITGSGDPFASPIFWSYLKELASAEVPDNLGILLQTNGVMMTEHYWNEIKPLWKAIRFVNISVDAATEATYKIVRKNGNFTKLKNNLEFFDQMVLDKQFPNLYGWQTNFIVQKANYKELKEFVEWQLSYKSIRNVWTNLIAQWHHLSDEEYTEMAIWKEGNEDRDILIEILKDPIFKNPKIKLGNMNALVPR